MRKRDSLRLGVNDGGGSVREGQAVPGLCVVGYGVQKRASWQKEKVGRASLQSPTVPAETPFCSSYTLSPSLTSPQGRSCDPVYSGFSPDMPFTGAFPFSNEDFFESSSHVSYILKHFFPGAKTISITCTGHFNCKPDTTIYFRNHSYQMK